MKVCHLRHKLAGFALIEALVAFAILSIALATIMSGIAMGLRADRHATESRVALRAVQDRLERLGVSDPLIPGRSEGVTERGQRWRQTVVKIDVPRDRGSGRPASSGYVAFWAQMTLTTESGTDISLGGLKLALVERRPRK